MSFEFIAGLSRSKGEEERDEEGERKWEREREGEKIRGISGYRIAIIIGFDASSTYLRVTAGPICIFLIQRRSHVFSIGMY